MTRRLQLAFFLLLATSTLSLSQDLPDKIRGYKVHEEKISICIAGSAEIKGEKAIVVVIGKPKIESIGLSGVEATINPTATGVDRSGKVEMITFKDLTINGIPASVAEYDAGFDLVSGRDLVMPKPFRVTIGPGSAAKAAYRELADPKKKWRITGTAFIFGRFKKFGFTFRRVVPLPFDITIDDPLRT